MFEDKVRELVELPAKNNPDFVDNFLEFFPVERDTVEAIGRIKNDKKRLSLAKQIADDIYAEKEFELGEDTIQKIEREVYMQILDTLWMNHLENMNHLREGIHWRSVGQRDPLVEYRSESQKLFDGLQNTLRDEAVRIITHIQQSDVLARNEEDHETELTRLAENSVESGVNEVLAGEKNRDDDFSAKKSSTASEKNARKNKARKTKKAQRQNKKKGRK